MKDSKNLVIGMLCAVVCVMAVAYAAFSTTLTITTNTTIDSNWCVKIKEASCTGSATINPVENTLSTDIEMTFVQPGDSATCRVTYGNCGTLDAKLAHVVKFDGKDAPAANEEGAIIYSTATETNPSGIRFTVTGLSEATELAKGAGNGAYGGLKEITIVGEYIDVAEGQGNSATNSASLSIVTSASQK